MDAKKMYTTRVIPCSLLATEYKPISPYKKLVNESKQM